MDDPELGTLRRYQYAECNANWDDPGKWTLTTITTHYETVATREDDSNRYFAISAQGTVGLVHTQRLEDGQEVTVYRSCDGDPTDPKQWRETMITSNYIDKPSLVYYLWCTEGDVMDPANWRFNNVGIYFSAGGVDLALDAQGRPRISCEASDGLAYGWCNANAESSNAVWQHRTVESNAALAADYELFPIHKCTLSSWSNGQRSALALDGSGNPRIAYDAQHIWSGVYVDQPWESCYIKDVTITRLACLNLTPSLSIRRNASDALEILFANGVLESASSLTGPWQPVSPSSSPLVVPISAAQQFYRVRRRASRATQRKPTALLRPRRPPIIGCFHVEPVDLPL